MHEKNCTIHTLKNPPHLVTLLGKIHALSIEVLKPEVKKIVSIFWVQNELTSPRGNRLAVKAHKRRRVNLKKFSQNSW